MKRRRLADVLAGMAAVMGGVAFVAEVVYWLSHLSRPGPAVHIALSALGVVFLSIAFLLQQQDR
jgi:hypothetical protein